MSEFRAYSICTNLNTVRKNIIMKVVKPGVTDLTSLGLQWIITLQQ